MTIERLPWFQCYPTKLLGALAGMGPDEGYLYVIILLRIYDIGGPISDDAAALARRSGFTRRRTEAALEVLFAKGKLITADGLISNPQAEKFMTAQMEKQNERKQKAKSAATVRWTKTETNQQSTDADALLGDANKEKEVREEEKNTKKEKRSRADRATRIPEDWQLTPEMGNYGRSRGLTRREVLNEADKFVRYWRGRGGEKGRKVDWKSTWENWCISSAERLGRQPRDAAPDTESSPQNFDRKTWETLATLYQSTNNWQRTWGPEPGPGCLMPPDLQKQFVNLELTDA